MLHFTGHGGIGKTWLLGETRFSLFELSSRPICQSGSGLRVKRMFGLEVRTQHARRSSMGLDFKENS